MSHYILSGSAAFGGAQGSEVFPSFYPCLCFKVGDILAGLVTVDLFFQEYERAVIFRLGRLLSGGARGPGVFFIIPCVDIYEKIDMRTQTFDVPPQEVLNCKVI
jgi:hypothetical protein